MAQGFHKQPAGIGNHYSRLLHLLTPALFIASPGFLCYPFGRISLEYSSLQAL
jgi:hypothetical protein